MPWKQIQLGPYVLKERGVSVTSAASLHEGQAALEFLHGLEERNPFWIGDVWNDLKMRVPETYSQILDHARWNEATLDNYAWVAKRIPPDKRRFDQGVEFTKHSAVAALVPTERDRLLEKAHAERLTLSAVRQEARLIRRQTVATGQAPLEGRFRVAVIDPEYRESTIADVAKWAVPANLTPNAAVFIRHYEAQRFEVAQLLEAWGIWHKRTLIWDRVNHQGPDGYGINGRTDYVLLAIRGKLPPDRTTPMQQSVMQCKSDGPVPVERIWEVALALYDGPALLVTAANEMVPWEQTRRLHAV